MTENKKTVYQKIFEWLDDRVGLQPVIDLATHKEVPVTGHSFAYYFGGVALFLFIVQVMTGLLLLLYYQPGEDTAYESVKYIITQVKFGWLVRAIHSWSANLMILSVVLHMFTVFFTFSFRKPRELTWLTGMGLLGLAMFFGFSGYLLPYNELAYFATRVGTGMAGAIPVVGETILKIMRGGEEVTGATVSRFFALHISVLPMLFMGLLGAHLFFIQKQGMADPIEWEKSGSQRKTMRFFPNFMLRDFVVWLVVLDILLLLAVFFPDGIGVVHWPLGNKADPFMPPPAVIKPEWYFIWTFQFLKFLPSHIWFMEGELVGLIALNVGGMFWGLLPFFAKEPHQGKKKVVFKVLGVFVLVFVIVMTVLGYVLE